MLAYRHFLKIEREIPQTLLEPLFHEKPQVLYSSEYGPKMHFILLEEYP